MASFTPIQDKDGNYVSLFPAMYLNCTQTWGAGTLSHRNHQTDWSFPENEYPYYACAPMTCYAVTSSGFIWTTDSKVVTPSGLDYISVWVAHDNDASRAAVGSHVDAGALLGRSGVRGYATGDHLHLDCALGHNVGYASNYEALADDRNPAEVFYITADYTVANTTANGITIEFPVYEAITTYTLAVVNGSADKTTGEKDDTTTITANVAPRGQKFEKWTIDGAGSISDIYSESAAFTFGEGDATVTANFRKRMDGGDIVLFSVYPFIKNNEVI